MNTLALHILLGLLLFFSAISVSHAGVIAPDLRSVLESVAASEDISILITLSNKADLDRAKREKDKRRRRSRIIEELKDKADLTHGPLKALLQSRGSKRLKSLWIINGIAATVPAWTVTELAGLPEVERVGLDHIIQVPPIAMAATSTPEWNLTALKAPELWASGFTGTGIVVANMDTGVDINHPDLQNRWRGGTNSWFNPYSDPANSGDCRIPGHCTPCELSANNPCDGDGHGTNTMGVIVGGDAGGTAIGMAPGAKWIGVKIFNDAGKASLSIIHQGFQWLLDPDNNPNTDDAPDVVNNSWTLENVNDCSLEFQPDIQTLRAAGIAAVFAAGNSGPNPSTSVSPANNPEAIAAGALDQSLHITSFSSRGPSACDGNIFPEFVVPGAQIRTSDLTSGGIFPNSYAIVSGTSVAAPHVAGAMALILDAFPHLTLPELEFALQQSALDLGTTGPDNDYGYGLIDVVRAHQLLLVPERVTTGVFRPSTGDVFLKNTSTSGLADLRIRYGLPGDKPISGDWDGDRIDTIGVFRNGFFYLRNSNTSGFADIAFAFGLPEDLPVAGDWDGDGIDTIGVYSNGIFHLRNSNSSGPADQVFALGIPGDIPIAGDWTGKGFDTVGVFRPSSGQLFLKNTNTTGFADIVLNYGLPGDKPLAGDWNGDGIDTIGVYRDGTFYLRNSNTPGFADIVFDFGIPGDEPVAGDWDGLP
jgi:subtilisin family serine protease